MCETPTASSPPLHQRTGEFLSSVPGAQSCWSCNFFQTVPHFSGTLYLLTFGKHHHRLLLRRDVERSRPERHFCSLLPHFFTLLTSNFPTLFDFLNFILWSGSFFFTTSCTVSCMVEEVILKRNSPTSAILRLPGFCRAPLTICIQLGTCKQFSSILRYVSQTSTRRFCGTRLSLTPAAEFHGFCIALNCHSKPLSNFLPAKVNSLQIFNSPIKGFCAGAHSRLWEKSWKTKKIVSVRGIV